MLCVTKQSSTHHLKQVNPLTILVETKGKGNNGWGFISVSIAKDITSHHTLEMINHILIILLLIAVMSILLSFREEDRKQN
jgi:hypothetical protein